MTISHLYPTQRPALDLNFARQKRLDSRVTYTRASTGTYVGSDGLIKTAASGEARFDHDPVTGESLGLFVEEGRTNLFSYSEDFNSKWVSMRVSATANSTTAPDGTTTASTLSVTQANTYAYLFDFLNTTNGTAYSISFWVKYNNCQYVWLLGAEQPNAFAFFDVLNGSVANASSYTCSVTPYPNGWYRITATKIKTGATGNEELGIGISRSTSASNNQIGDAVYVWGAQFEQGSFPTSYIPTSGSTVARSADVASMTGTNFSSWYNQSEGTFLMEEASSQSPTSNTHRLEIYRNGAADTDAVVLVSGYSTGGTRLLGRAGGSNTSLDLIVNNTSTNTAGKRAVALKTNDCSIVRGSSSGTDSASTFPQNLDALGFGAPSNTFQSNSVGMNTISRLTYYPTRLSDTQLQALTL